MEMDLKKNLIEKYFFIMEKKNFEKKSQKNFRNFSIFQLENRFFQVNILLEKIDFPIEKIENFRKFFRDFFSKLFFSMMKKYFSMRFFLKFISRSRRIVLKKFQSDCSSLKIRTLKEKSVEQKLEDIW